MDNNIANLLTAARQAINYAYSPYSSWKVGASVLMDNGKIYSGCNIENASYGATVCAERVAIWKGISDGATKIINLLVYVEKSTPWPPCGLCLQVISEFCTPTTQIILTNHLGDVYKHTFYDFLPKSFSGQHLSKI